MYIHDAPIKLWQLGCWGLCCLLTWLPGNGSFSFRHGSSLAGEQANKKQKCIRFAESDDVQFRILFSYPTSLPQRRTFANGNKGERSSGGDRHSDETVESDLSPDLSVGSRVESRDPKKLKQNKLTTNGK